MFTWLKDDLDIEMVVTRSILEYQDATEVHVRHAYGFLAMATEINLHF